MFKVRGDCGSGFGTREYGDDDMALETGFMFYKIVSKTLEVLVW